MSRIRVPNAGNAKLMKTRIAPMRRGGGGPAASAPVSVDPPVVADGSYRVGDMVNASAGTFTGLPTPTRERRWQYGDTGSWTTIAASDSLSLVAPAAAEGLNLRMQEQATNSEGASGWITSNVVGPVAPAVEVTTPPSIPDGSYTVGDTVVATAGVFAGQTPLSRTRQWQYRPPAGSWTDIAGATSLSLTFPEIVADADTRLLETATNAAGTSGPVASNVVGPIAAAVVPAAFVNPPTITPPTGDVGQVYLLDIGNWSGTEPVTVSWTLTHSVLGDVTSEVVSFEYDSSGAPAGVLTLSVSIQNSANPSPVVATDTADITEVDVPPSFISPPTIEPALGGVGQVFTIYLGEHGGTSPSVSWSLELDSVDVTSEVVAGEYTSDAEGELVLTVILSNEAGLAGPATDTATVAAAGELRTAIATDAPINGEGNSQLVTMFGPEHGGNLITRRAAQYPGSATTRTFVAWGILGGWDDGGGNVAPSTWAADGAGRNTDCTDGIFVVNEGLLATQVLTGFPAPGSAQDNNTLTYVNGYVRAAAGLGAKDFVIYANWPVEGDTDFDAPIQAAQFWRAHAAMHNPEMPVWVFPTAYCIEEALAYYGTSDIYVGTNDPHIDETNYPAIPQAIAYVFDAFAQMALPSDYGTLSGDLLALVDLMWARVQEYRWSGFGGVVAPADLLYAGNPLSEANDPLPEPLPLLPGEDPPYELDPAVEITPTTYTGPPLTGPALPAAVGGFRTFTTSTTPRAGNVAISDTSYFVAAIRIPSVVSGIHSFAYLFDTNPDGVPRVQFGVNGYVGQFAAVVIDATGTDAQAAVGGVDAGSGSSNWHIIEMWGNIDTAAGAIDGVAGGTGTNGAITGWSTIAFQLFRKETGDPDMTVEVAAGRLYGIMPDETDRAAIRAEMAAYIPPP